MRAHLAELFVRLGRLDDAAEQIDALAARSRRPSTAISPARTSPRRTTTTRTTPQAIPALREAARLALDDDDAGVDRAHAPRAVRRADGRARSRGAALETARRLVDAVPDTLRGRVQLAALAWATGALDEAAAALAGALELEPNDVEARILLAELQVATNQIAAAKASFPRRHRSRRGAAGRSPTRSPAGWCCAARWPRRRSWPIG